MFSVPEASSVQHLDFVRQHHHEDVYTGAIGGHLTYSFTGTSLGEVCRLKCSVCGEIVDLSDYSAW